MNFQINLATRVYVDFQKINLLITLAFALILIWIAFNFYSFLSVADEIDRFSDLKAGVAAKSGAKSVSEADYSKLLTNIKFANTVLIKRSYDWLNLLDNLEQVVPDSVSLRALEPSDKGQTIKLSGSAINFASVRKFIENLESSKKFADIFLTEHSTVTVNKQSKGINFTVTCKVLI